MVRNVFRLFGSGFKFVFLLKFQKTGMIRPSLDYLSPKHFLKPWLSWNKRSLKSIRKQNLLKCAAQALELQYSKTRKTGCN